MDRGSWYCIRGSDQDHPQEKEMQKGKIVVWEGLTNRWEKKRSKRQDVKERYTDWNAEFQRIARRDKKAFLSNQCKEIEENDRMGRLAISSRKLEIPREHSEKAMAPHSSILAWKIHRQRSLVGCSPWGRYESDTTEQLHFHFLLSCIGEGNGNTLKCSCLENPRDREAW